PGGARGPRPCPPAGRFVLGLPSPALEAPSRDGARAAAADLAALPREPLELRGVVALGDEVSPAEDARDVEPRRRDPRRPPRLGDELRRTQRGLRRHARPVGALPADQPTFDQCDLDVTVEPAEGADKVLAGRPSTENDDSQRATSGGRWPGGTAWPRRPGSSCR